MRATDRPRGDAASGSRAGARDKGREAMEDDSSSITPVETIELLEEPAPAPAAPTPQADRGGDVADAPSVSLVDILQSNEFMIASALGAAIVLFDAWRRYNELAVPTHENDVVRGIEPRFLATNADYANSFAIYMLLRLVSYGVPAIAILFVFMRGGVIEALGLPSYLEPIVTNHNFPLFWGAVIAGVLPSFSFIKDVEQSIRQFAQTVGGIPTGVKRMARRMRNARLAPLSGTRRSLPKNDRFSFVQPQDFAETADPIDQKWARLAYIFNYFKEEHAKHALVDKFSDAHMSEILREENRFRSLQVRFAIHKVGYPAFEQTFNQSGLGMSPRTIATHDPFLESDIDELLTRFEVYLACALRSVENDDERAAERLRELGFQVEPTPRAGGLVGTFLGVIVALAAAAVIGSVISDLAVDAMSKVGAITYPKAVLDGLGENMLQRAIGLLGYTLIIVTTVLVASSALGTVLFGIDTRQVDERPLAERPISKYLLASLFGGFCGMISLVGMVLPDPSFIDEPGKLQPLLYWMPSMVSLAFMVHLFAYGRRRGAFNLIRNAMLIGLVYGSVAFLGAIPAFERQGLPADQALGAATYFSFVSFWVGLIVSSVFIQLNKAQRDMRLDAEAALVSSPIAHNGDPGGRAPTPA